MSRTSRRRKVIIVVCLAVVAVGVMAAIFVTTQGVPVPDVTGKTQAEAAQALEDAGLSVGDVGEAADPDAQPGTVVRQSEEPDPPSDPAVPTAVVPDLVGTELAAAEAELEELGLRPVPLDAPDATAPAGTVYAQLPAAGTEVPKTYPVLLLVSTGAGLQVSPSPAGE